MNELLRNAIERGDLSYSGEIARRMPDGYQRNYTNARESFRAGIYLEAIWI